MKNKLFILFAIGIVLSVSSSAGADGDVFTIMLREWFPGIENGGVTKGALASGNIFDDSNGNNVGWVNISWNHNGLGIEECGEDTELIRIRIVMNFFEGGRLVLIGPANRPGSRRPRSRPRSSSRGCQARDRLRGLAGSAGQAP